MTTSDKDKVGESAPHIGQMRVKFHFNKCGTATIISQAIKNDDDQFTFRKWNPNKLQVPYGVSTDADASGVCSGYYLCKIVNCCMDSLFEEVIDHAGDGNLKAEQYFIN